VPLVLFEDPDVLELRIARLSRVHLLNTAGWLLALAKSGIEPGARELLRKIDERRTTPLDPIDRPARTRKVISRFPLRKLIP
jgi:hypothetical protein